MPNRALVTLSNTSQHSIKDVRIGAVLVSELKLHNVQRHIFGARFVERVDHALYRGASVRSKIIARHKNASNQSTDRPFDRNCSKTRIEHLCKAIESRTTSCGAEIPIPTC
jgi:hypothetical protein